MNKNISFSVGFVFLILCLILGGCSPDGKESDKGMESTEALLLEKSPLLSVEDPQNEDMADLLQRASSGAMVQVRVGQTTGSGVIWNMTKENLVIVTAEHVLTQGEGAVTVCFADGFTADAGEFMADTGMDLAFLTVDLQEIPEESLTLYYRVNADEKNPASVQKGDGMILMASVCGVAAEASEGIVLDPWIYLEDFAQYMMLVKVEAEPGMSGGGIFDYSGRFVGILCGGDAEGEGAVLTAGVIAAVYENISENF